jgi:hypothetical protein
MSSCKGCGYVLRVVSKIRNTQPRLGPTHLVAVKQLIRQRSRFMSHKLARTINSSIGYTCSRVYTLIFSLPSKFYTCQISRGKLTLKFHLVKRKQKRYSILITGLDRPLRVPVGWGSQISRHSAHEGGKVVTPTHRPPLPPGISWYSWYYMVRVSSCTMCRYIPTRCT